MNQDNLDRMAGDPIFIPGIYNYCDRWCERCTFALRCLTFATEQEESRERKANDEENTEFWKSLSSDVDTVMRQIDTDANQDDFSWNNEEFQQLEADQEQIRSRARQHPVAMMSMCYGQRVDQWTDAACASLERKQSELEARGQIDEEGMAPHIASVDIDDALAVIRWYQTFIHVKLMRALQGQERGDELAEQYDFPKDSDGSAKVALIGIDRSIGAWAALQKHLPDQADAIHSFLSSLCRLRKNVETEFPDARAFKRPGFDCIPEPGA